MEWMYFNLSSSLLFLILALILFFKKLQNNKTYRYFGMLCLCIAIYNELVYLHFDFVENTRIAYLSWYLPIDGLVIMLMGPFLYFFSLSLVGKPFRLLHWHSVLHLLPLMPLLVFNILFSFRSQSERIDWLINDFERGSVEMNLINAVLYVQVIVYLVLSFRVVNRQYQLSKYVDNNGYRIDVSWLRLFLLINIVVVCLSLPVCFVINNERTSILVGRVIMNIELLFLFVRTALKMSSMDSEKNNEKKLVHKVNEKHAELIWQQLVDYMTEKKPYLDEHFCIRHLSEQISIPEHQLSQSLNAHVGISFADFINEYRIREAMIYLQDKNFEKMSMDDIAFECGFGSRSSFYRIFKKSVQMTPVSFKKQHRLNNPVLED